ncbi:hypothetical protein [Rhodopirellula sp. MGV]|uniref:hypothetical protein n=1 Tax=Rhodopirellula sp. MGV TaxID=2023130 RepID=UPI000B968332|nr:hypothetical protein [Rhodopirellula sp. MGV]OYP34322.1 hypothetical protein CGZ80_14755 [Rhodopirellula sp. MGV]PNY35277.1 hypothetical protein C2E31_19235 [Rhodopirellula baltica]
MKLPQLHYDVFFVAVMCVGCSQSEPPVTTATVSNMNDQYTASEMPPFPTDYDGVMKVLAPYYHEQRPLDFFFEMYIANVIEQLPNETLTALDDFSAKHPTYFENHDGDWRQFVRKELHLSETIEVAIWDLWIRNSAKAKDDGRQYHPWYYAQNFADNFFAEGSRVDAWDGKALEEARERVRLYRENAR